MKTTRKTLGAWIRHHLGPCSRAQHERLYSGYLGHGAGGDYVVVAVQKHKQAADFTVNRDRWETGFNATIWNAICRADKPVRLVVVHDGKVYLHRARDIRRETPEIRYVHGQRFHDETGVAWFRWDDFDDCTGGLPEEREHVEAEPRAPEQPDILDLFNPQG